MKSNHTPAPWAWQLFGDTYCLTAQHGTREIIISAIPHGQMKYLVVAMNLDGRLQDVDPKHPNARLIAQAPIMLKELEETYLSLQVEVQKGLNNGSATVAVRTDHIRANLRNVLCAIAGFDSQQYQAHIESMAKEQAKGQ